MNDIVENAIGLLSPADYVKALRSVNPTEQQLAMLHIHLAAPGHTLTVRQLASAVGYARWNAANLHYGKLAGRLCKELAVAPQQHLQAIVESFNFSNSECELRLRPAVVEALTELGMLDVRWTNHEEFSIEKQLVEGASFVVQVNAFERNPVARRKCVEHYGARCVACGFDFSVVYGDWAAGYIHVHHLVPLAAIGHEYVINPIKDMRPVCPNCHAVIHMRQPPYSIEEVQKMKKV